MLDPKPARLFEKRRGLFLNLVCFFSFLRATITETDLPSVTPISDGYKAVLDMMTTMHSQTGGRAKAPTRPSSSFPSPHVSTTHLPGSASDKEKEKDICKEKGLESATGSVDSRALSKAEADRAHAIDGLTQTCVRLMRKTKLQVRVAVEVIHCKSPKHLITEAVSFVLHA